MSMLSEDLTAKLKFKSIKVGFRGWWALLKIEWYSFYRWTHLQPFCIKDEGFNYDRNKYLRVIDLGAFYICATFKRVKESEYGTSQRCWMEKGRSSK